MMLKWLTNVLGVKKFSKGEKPTRKIKIPISQLDGREGILPLSTSSLTINQDVGQSVLPGIRKGRFYFTVIAGKEEESLALVNRLREFLINRDFFLY